MQVINTLDSTYVHVVEQNGSPTGYNTYPRSEAECYLTARSASGPSCGSGMYGPYCGTDGVFGAADTLYWCLDGKVKNSTVCTSNGEGFCETMPTGTYDRCVSGSCAGKPDGYFCGDDGIGGPANALFFCSGGKITSSKACASGCTIVPGANDVCA